MPFFPDFGTADILEYRLLLLDEESWGKIDLRDRASSGGPVVTGDPVIDELERGLWEAEVANR